VVEGRPWLDPWAGVAAIQIDVPHGGAPGEQDAIVAELASLAWADPPVPFEITSMLTGEVIARAHGRLPTDQLDGLQAWFDGQTFSAWTRPMTGDELSMVRLTLPVVEAAAELAACGGQPSCHHDVSTFHQVVASPAGRLGIIFQGEEPDIAGLNGLEYPGWSMAPPGYMVDGATGLLSFDSLRDVALDRWGLGEALSIKPDDNPGLLGLSLADWLAAWTADDVPLLYSGTADLDGDGYDSTAHGGGDCDDEDPEIHPGAEELFNCIDDDCDGSLLPGEDADSDGDGWLACDDCDDGNPDIHPGGDDGWVPGNCDGLDSNCDGLLGPDETDDDGDGFSECDGDMDDTDPGVQGPPPAPQLWSAVSAMDLLAAARSCQAEPTCTSFDAPAGLVTDPATGQPLLSIHSKGAMDIGPLLDWAAATPGVVIVSKLVHVFDMTGHEVDVSMDLLDPSAWAGLRDALELIGSDAFASIHGVHEQVEGVHPSLAGAEASIAACAGDVPCLEQLHESEPWLSPFEELGAVQLEVPHDGQAGKHDSIVAELEGLSWGEPAVYFAVDDGAGGHLVRAVGRMTVAQLAGLQGWMDGQPFTAWSRPLAEDEFSMLRLQLAVAEAAADLVACFGDASCHHAVGQAHGVVVSPAGRLGIVFQGEDPDVEGLNGLEYPGWTMAPAGYMVDGATGLVSWESLRDLGLGRWSLGEALSVKVDDNTEISLLPVEEWLASFAPDDEPLFYTPVPKDADGDCYLNEEDYLDWSTLIVGGCGPDSHYFDGVDCDDSDSNVYPGAPDLCDGKDNDCDPSTLESFMPLGGEGDEDGDGHLACDDDCDDYNGTVFSGAEELCDGLDNDCDWLVEDGGYDFDEDGYLACEDCDDFEATVHPGAPEICDGLDSNCDGVVPPDEIDDDGDGWPNCDDCVDWVPTFHPGAPELCDGLDNDCDGVVPPDEIDDDGDGQAECDGDCDDTDPNIFDTGGDQLPEVCDGKDNDCNGYVDHYFSFSDDNTAHPRWQVADDSPAEFYRQGTADHIPGYVELITTDEFGAESEVFDGASSNPRARAGALILHNNPNHKGIPASTPFCATFSFRVIWPGDSDGDVPSDGFTFVMFDADDVPMDISDEDWLDEGGWGYGYLGTYDYGGSAGTSPGWAVEFDLFSNGDLGDPTGNERHVGLSRLGNQGDDLVTNSLINLHRFFPDFIGNSGYDLLAPAGAVARTAQQDPPAPGEDDGWFTVTIGRDPIGHESDTLLVQIAHPEDGTMACDVVPDPVTHSGNLLLGFTAGSATAGYQTVEIESFGITCAACPAMTYGCEVY
jgi:hypothetical protein